MIAGQHQPHRRLHGAGEVRQRADFIQQPQRQMMGLVDEQKRAAARNRR